MSRRPAIITQSYLLRAIKAAKKVGMTVEIRPDGSLLIVPLPVQDVAPQQATVARGQKWAL